MTVELSTSDSIARLVLNRPEKLNAVNGKMAEDLLAAITRIASESPRVLIMSGAGRGFCAGRDLDDAEPADEDAEAVLSEIFNPLFGAIR
ncbi:MAG: enoyl-CoA hydratase-related protein, partial [bacterium]|nr:enoyl-CoA hydratase-related protein [bacterium]